MTSPIRSRKHSPARYAVALAALTAVAMPVLAHARALADDAFDTSDSTEVVVKGERQGFKVSNSSSVKRTEALVDTPQTLTVINSDVIRQQGATTLVDALRNTPGITMQLGENGNTSAGDTFQLRGFSAQSALFLDGIRDLGAVSRDTFNIEQIEIAKGPAGADIGRGASSGYINLVSKLPNLGGGTSGSLTAYSQGGLRLTADTDFAVGDSSAVRLNVFSQDVDTAGRDYVNRSGRGVAPAWGIGLGTATRFYVLGQYLKQNNTPDGGIPTIGYDGFYNANANLNAGKRVDPENFYGSPNDHEDVESAMVTGKIEHDFGDNLRLTNITRYGSSSMDRVLTGVNALNVPASADPSTWTVARTRQKVEQENTVLVNQTNLRGHVTTGSVVHSLSGGVEIMSETQFSRTWASSYNIPGSVVSVTIPAASLYTPNVNDALPDLLDTGGYNDGKTTTVAAYVFDTAKFGDKWLVSGGVRLDSFTTTTTGARRAAAADAPIVLGTLINYRLKVSDTVASWNAGVVYKLRPNGSVYVAVGNSINPPGGANFALSDSPTNVANPNLDPQETGNVEVGTKWDLLDRKLAVTAAWYRTEHENEIVEDIDPGAGITVRQFGKRKVEGIELSATGQITADWQIIAGVATMKTEVEDGPATGNNSAGAAARWSPDFTASLWTSYKVNDKITLAIGGNYVSDQLRVVDPATNLATSAGLAKIPAYTVINAMAAYNISDKVALRLNIYNLLDEDYIGTLNNGGSRLTPGAPLNGALTLNVRF